MGLSSGFYIDGFKEKFLSSHHLNRCAGTIRAGEPIALGCVFKVAVQAVESGGDASKMEFCPCSYCVFADKIPIELHRIVYNAGEVSDDQEEVGYLGCP